MPSLVIFNPPSEHAVPLRVRRILGPGNKFVGVVSVDVRDIGYRHVDDGKLYRHDFDPAVDMFAIVGPDGGHCVLLMGSKGQSLWEEFE